MPLSGFGSPHGPLWPPCKLRFLPSKPSGNGDGDDDDDDDDDDDEGPNIFLTTQQARREFRGFQMYCHFSKGNT
jgi:hypothetical protein